MRRGRGRSREKTTQGIQEPKEKKGREGDGEGLGVREQRSRAEGSSYQGSGQTWEFITRMQHAGNKTQYHMHICGDSCSTASNTNNRMR